ncbi:MAG: methyltransferase domain-containing protein [Chloroflexota bacterium]
MTNKTIDEQIQEEIERLKRDVVDVEETDDGIHVVWKPRTATDSFEETITDKKLTPKDAQIYADLQLSRGASRPVDKDFSWVFDDPAEDAVRHAQRNQERLDHFTKFVDLKPTSKILDIGLRSAQLLHYLKQKGYTNLKGVDIVKLNVLISIRNGFDAEVADVHELTSVVGENKFDAIFAYHVLEHCYDPPKVAQEFYKALTDDGALHIEIPISPVDLKYAHVYAYQAGELPSLLKAAGFHVYDVVNEKGNETVVASKKPMSFMKKIKQVIG